MSPSQIRAVESGAALSDPNTPNLGVTSVSSIQDPDALGTLLVQGLIGCARTLKSAIDSVAGSKSQHAVLLAGMLSDLSKRLVKCEDSAVALKALAVNTNALVL